MEIHWKMSIGYPGACQTGTIDIPDEEFEGLTELEKEEKVQKEIWEDAMQYVDVCVINEDED